MTYRLTAGERTLDLTSAGDVQLFRAGERYFAGNLSDLITASAGRPWRVAMLTSNRWAVTAAGNCLLARWNGRPLSVEMKFSFADADLLALDVRWHNGGGQALSDVAVGVVLAVGGAGRTVTMPQVMYNSNRASQRRVPRPDQGFVCEDSRLPIPAVSVEWNDRYVNAFTPGGNVSLGVLPGPAIAVLSGVIMFDGVPDVCYVSKAATEMRPEGYRTLAADAEIRLRILLDYGPGPGVRSLVRTGRTVFSEPAVAPLELDDIIRLKALALDSRWYSGPGGVAGYTKFAQKSPANGKPAHFMYGWTGQCLKLAWCEAMLGLTDDQPGRVDRAIAAADFYVTAGGRYSCYEPASGRWSGFRRGGEPMISSRAFGETMADLADLVLLLLARGRSVSPDWISTLNEADEFWSARLRPDGTFPIGWRPDGMPLPDESGGAGIPCILGTLKTFRVTGNLVLLDAAADWLARYDIPACFSHSTLDASGEDKEAGIFFFLAAYELFSLTGEPRYAQWASIAADWLLTFVYVWTPRFPPGSPLAQRGFSAVGWPGVSVQNHHLDAFFPTYELLAFGTEIGEQRFVDAAWQTMSALGQGICTEPGDWEFAVVGEQAEAFFPTNWQARGTSNTWNPSWVIAQVLSNALRIREFRASRGLRSEREAAYRTG